ncbi:MAG TPA: BON domain-containing protein [Steroidobacteraceae bacterium]|nr:BON domain-containing protein [Steroidobacteraceae bacterium]
MAVAAIFALLTACATNVPRPPPAPSALADQALANQVYVALNADPWYFFRHVDVRVDHGVADLSGYVWSADAVYQARQITAAVPGIRRVVTSNLELERNGLANGVTR